MYFSLEPKSRMKDLYDRKKELRNLENAIESGKIVLLTGIRRIGKTSLLNVFLNERKKSGTHYIFADCRTFLRRGNFFDKKAFNEHIVSRIQDTFGTPAFKKALKSVSNIKTPWLEIEFKKKNDTQLPLVRILEDVNLFLKKSKKTMILAVDEAQNLRLDGSGGFEFLNLLAYAYDHLPNVKFILTGSEVGVLHDFLKLTDADSPLFGRHTSEIMVQRFSREDSINFLIEGLTQVGIKPDKSRIEKAVDILDGLVGYLVIFGYTVSQTGDYDGAISETLESAEQLVRKEMEGLFEKSGNYRVVLEAVAHKMNTFSRIKQYFLMYSLSINDRTLTNLLKALVKYSYLEERIEGKSKRYVIPDPIVERVLSE